jgi:sigma54-dependent transcription regulator
MAKESWLVAWVGDTDHKCAEGAIPGQTGPIASAIQQHARFDRIHLLTNYSHERTERYCQWLEAQCPGSQVDLTDIDLTSPIDYADIYGKVVAELQQCRLPRDDVSLTFHLSPGTPAMAAIWIILAKTRFPANLIQTSQQGTGASQFHLRPRQRFPSGVSQAG